jgi:hypothetical protein
MPRPGRSEDRSDPFLSGEIVDAEVLDAQVLDADVVDAEVLDADVVDAAVLDASVVDAIIEGEVLDAPAPLPLDNDPVTFNLDDLEDATASVRQPTDEPPRSARRGADLLELDADPPRPATRTATHPPAAKRPAVRITFVCPGEASPLAPGGR